MSTNKQETQKMEIPEGIDVTSKSEKILHENLISLAAKKEIKYTINYIKKAGEKTLERI